MVMALLNIAGVERAWEQDCLNCVISKLSQRPTRKRKEAVEKPSLFRPVCQATVWHSHVLGVFYSLIMPYWAAAAHLIHKGIGQEGFHQDVGMFHDGFTIVHSHHLNTISLYSAVGCCASAS